MKGHPRAHQPEQDMDPSELQGEAHNTTQPQPQPQPQPPDRSPEPRQFSLRLSISPPSGGEGTDEAAADEADWPAQTQTHKWSDDWSDDEPQSPRAWATPEQNTPTYKGYNSLLLERPHLERLGGGTGNGGGGGVDNGTN